MVSLEFVERQGLVPLFARYLFRSVPSVKENRPRIAKCIDFRAFFSFEWSFLTIVLIPLRMLDAADESKPGLLTRQDVNGKQALKPLQAAIPPHFRLADERLLLRTNHRWTLRSHLRWHAVVVI